MKMSRQLVSALSLVALFAASPALAKKEAPPEVTEDGLRLVHDSEFQLVYVEPGADLSGYDKVILLDTYVAFKKNWQRDHNRKAASTSSRVSDRDMETIKTRLSEAFHNVFVEVLTEDDDWPVVSDAADDVLVLRPAIINLDVVSTDSTNTGRTRTYAESAGAMTLYLEIRDSLTGDLIAKGLDRQADRGTGFMTWQSRVQNSQAAKTILTGWAEALRDGLDRAKAAGPIDLD